MRALLVLGGLSASSPAFAQHIELSPIVSYTTAAAIEPKAIGVQELGYAHGITWGAEAGYFFSTHLGFEALLMRQSTAVSMSTGSGTVDLFTATIAQYHGSVVYQFGTLRQSARPFVFGGLGASVLGAHNFQDETKFSWTVGGGLKWSFQKHVGLRAQARYKPTELGAASSNVCGPLAFCQQRLDHVEMGGGLVFAY
jgi:opacity protein-like surface antigen